MRGWHECVLHAGGWMSCLIAIAMGNCLSIAMGNCQSARKAAIIRSIRGLTCFREARVLPCLKATSQP